MYSQVIYQQFGNLNQLLWHLCWLNYCFITDEIYDVVSKW